MSIALDAPTRPFSERQWQDLQSLLREFDARQSAWLSGFLAARAETGKAPEAPNATSDSSPLIAFGSETGNSEALARQLAAKAARHGLACDVVNLATLKLRQLAKVRQLLLICSTHGDGEPPEPIQNFHNALLEDRAPRLPGLRYSVLALGDSSYAQFCATGRQFDERLAALGATRLAPRQECDVDFNEPAAQWMDAVLAALPQAAVGSVVVPATAPTARASYSKQQPLTVEVLANIRLSADRHQPTHHLELALDTSLPLQPGDALGVLADNPPALIATILDAAHLSGEQAVTIDGESMPLVQALRERRNLSVASPRFLQIWATLSGSAELAQIATDDTLQKPFLLRHQLRDLLARYPAHPDAQLLVDALRPLQPRLYDVANSLGTISDELHLTVQHYRYPFNAREESGVASEYLLQLQPGDTLRLYPHRHARFHLPDDVQTPLILIADGTGIAPYRAFLQQLQASGQRPPCWLVFAEQRFEQDFLYQLDWQQAQAEGRLQYLDTVFYQDSPGRTLADPLLDAGTRLHDWLALGAHLYLCGDQERLEACERRLETHYEAQRDPAAASWKQLVKDKRIHRNLY